MHRLRDKWLAGFLLPVIILSNLLLPSAALAQAPPTQAINIEISPLPILLNAQPGTAASADLRVRNGGTVPEKLKVVLKTFTAEGESGQVVLHDLNPGDELAQWVSFSKTVFDAPPGQWQTIKMSVNVPKTAAFGYYYAVQFELANPPKSQPGQAGLRGAVAIFVLLNAEAPGAVRKAEVASFTADHQTYEFLPVNFNVRLHAAGNLHVAPRGNIFIKRGSKQIASLAVNPTGGYVLPKSNRVFKAQWQDGFPVYEIVKDASGQPVMDKKGHVKRQLKWNFSKVSKLRFGRYTADLVLVYNDGQRDIPITGSVSFWVIPWRLVGVMLLVGIFVAIGLWSTTGKIKRFVERLRR